MLYEVITNSGYNDAFGFFLSGPGIAGPYANGAINIALVPGTSTPVTIDNVNSGSNSAYYQDNSTNPFGTTTVLDAFTTVLAAEAQIQCGQTYHIKIAIGDAGDVITSYSIHYTKLYEGKTEELIRRLKRVEFANQSLMLVKPVVRNNFV